MYELSFTHLGFSLILFLFSSSNQIKQLLWLLRYPSTSLLSRFNGKKKAENVKLISTSCLSRYLVLLVILCIWSLVTCLFTLLCLKARRKERREMRISKKIASSCLKMKKRQKASIMLSGFWSLGVGGLNESVKKIIPKNFL